MTLKTEILSTETSDFLKQTIFLKSFKSVLYTRSTSVLWCGSGGGGGRGRGPGRYTASLQ